jgi:hypothetical protein
MQIIAVIALSLFGVLMFGGTVTLLFLGLRDRQPDVAFAGGGLLLIIVGFGALILSKVAA